MLASLCPTPALSRIIKSKPAFLHISIASLTAPLNAVLSSLVANERIYALGWEIEFIRILSPSKAPPVFFFDGSTEITAIVFSLKLLRKRRTISSVTEDLPAPPVPVIPSTGTAPLPPEGETGEDSV